MNPESFNPTKKLEKLEKPRPIEIRLNFFRHDDKENSPDLGDQTKTHNRDYPVRLSEEGRINSVEQHRDDVAEQSVGYGSPRFRSKETVALHMLGEEVSLSGKETPEGFQEIMKSLNIATDEKLNFQFEADNDYVKKVYDQYKQGKLFEYFVKESDKDIIAEDDQESTSYSIAAANIGKIIQKYFTISDRFYNLANNPDKEYEHNLERFMGSHGHVTECFLAKVIQKTAGDEVLEEFVKAGHGNGFGFSEGFQVFIENDGDKKKVKIEYNSPEFSFQQLIDEELVREIIEEGNLFSEK
jgi:predicted RNA-binding protein with TRAM domain/uncharacterized protein (UPF0262 family)